MLWLFVGPTGVYLLDFFCSGIQFNLLLSVVSTVSLSLSHWYPGSGVVLVCIDSRSLHPYLLSKPIKCLMQDKSIAEYSPGASCNIIDLH